MPLALVVAFIVSIGIHLAALFGPDIDLLTEPESPRLMAELRPAPRVPLAPVTKAFEPALKPVVPPSAPAPKKNKVVRRQAPPATNQIAMANNPDTVPTSSVPSIPEAATPLAQPDPEPAIAAPEEIKPAPLPAPRLPPRGLIRYRVDRGESNFEIGTSRSEWEIVNGHYRLVSVLETAGLVRLFKSYRIEMESRGTITPEGLQPDSFSLRRNTDEIREKATFDWNAMKISVGDRPEQALSHGSQDFLSFTYQLGYMAHPDVGTTLPIATGRKYGVYQLEVVGDEEITLPAGTMRTLHLRAPGVNTTELWLAYDYLMLPVKIRHADNRGGIFMQLATEIQVGNQ